MGKIVKYCNACEEGFAEKFGFCPNCGAQLTAFELNPVETGSKVPEETFAEQIPAPAIIVETAAEQVIEAPAETDAFEFEAEVFAADAEDEAEEEAAIVAEPEPQAAPAVTVASVAVPVAEAVHRATYPARQSATRDGFHITIVEEKNVRQRNLLLLGSFALVFSALAIGFLYSLFNKALDVSALEVPELVAFIDDPTPTLIEEIEEKKDKDDGGGGGGGGKEEQQDASKGREAAQNPDPMFAPSARRDKLTNPTIPIQAATQNKNPRDAEKSDMPYGLRNGTDGISDGSGTGGGLGNGNGRGQGNGNGTGLGNGNGSGRGNGDGDGDGNGKGGGGNNEFDDPIKVGPTVGVKIISKPRPGYTDAARVNNIQGTVILKVTFNANGTIGGVSVVKGLPNGLTEQAIAAAKGIRFEPAKKGGSPYAVNKNVEYSFTIF